MKFTKKITKPVKVSTLLLGGMAHYDKHRGVDRLHVSDLTSQREEFCPREFAILGIEGRAKRGMTVNASMRHTFDMGRDIEHRVQNDYLSDIAVGNWRCQSCGELKVFSKRPKNGCDLQDINCVYSYDEVRVSSDGVTCGLDLLLDVSKPKLHLVELKTIIKEDFVKLAAPLVEHRLRTIFYLHMIRNNGPMNERIDGNRATVLYIAKSYGNWDKAETAMSPFKEFEVTYNEDLIKPYLDKATAFGQWYRDKKIPARVCPTMTCKRAKSCAVVAECWSGEYPPQKVWEPT